MIRATTTTPPTTPPAITGMLVDDEASPLDELVPLAARLEHAAEAAIDVVPVGQAVHVPAPADALKKLALQPCHTKIINKK